MYTVSFPRSELIFTNYGVRGAILFPSALPHFLLAETGDACVITVAFSCAGVDAVAMRIRSTDASGCTDARHEACSAIYSAQKASEETREKC